MSKEEGNANWNPRRFDGQEYSKFRLRFILFVKKKEWYTVLESGKPTASTEAEEALKWEKIDVKVQSTLVNAVSDKILDEIQHESTAKGMLDTLDSVYLRKTLMMRVLAKKRLLNLRLEEGEDAQDFFSRFERHISALKDAGEVVSVEEKLSYLLLILPDRYAHIIDVLDALPIEKRTVDYVKGKMMFDHCRAEKSSDFNAESAALKTQVFGRGDRSSRAVGRAGTSGNSYKCHRCGLPGHFRKNCRVDLQNGPQSSNAASVYGNKNSRGNVAAQNTEVEDVEVSVFQVKLVQSSTPSIGNVRSAEYGERNVIAAAAERVPAVATQSKGGGNRVSVVWTLDSGCTDHITNCDRYFFRKFKLSSPVNIKVADGHILIASIVGDIRMSTLVFGREVTVVLRDVYYAPELDNNLLSFDRITDLGYAILAKGDWAEIQRPDGGIIGIAKKCNKLYELKSSVTENVFCSLVNVSKSVLGYRLAERWHRMLGHVNYKDLSTLSSKQLLTGLPNQIAGTSRPCNICLESKFSNFSHTSVRARAKTVLEIVHSDVNFVTPVGLNAEIGFVSFIDDYSRLARVYCIKSKSEVVNRFMHYVNTMTNLTNSCIKFLRCDRGTEYLNVRFTEFCFSQGITLDPSPSYIHELNGTAERFNRTILNKARCLRLESNLPKNLWPECVKTAAYLGNRVLANTQEIKTPFELFFGERPDVSNLKPFGAEVFVRIPDCKRKQKMDSKAEKGILVGYMRNGYRVLIRGTVKETPYVRLAQAIEEPEMEHAEALEFGDDSTEEESGRVTNVTQDSLRREDEQQIEISSNTGEEIRENVVSSHSEETQTPTPARPVRQKKQPEHLKDYVIHIKLCTCICTPDTYKEAIKGEDAIKWKHSMQEELENLKRHNVWQLVDLPLNQKAIPVKWVFRVKADGKFKSRLVAVGFRQPCSLEEETYSPVAAMATLRVVLSLSCKFGYHLHQMDVESAFLNGDIKGEVYVGQPKGYETEDGKVYRLNKALYGLRESPRAWYDCFHKFLVELGFNTSDFDSCLYIKFVNRRLVGLILYVDDVLVFSQDLELVNHLKDEMKAKFRMTDMGPIRNYLGIRVQYDREKGTMELDQTQYIDSLAKRYNVEEMRRVKTPMEKNLKLPHETDCESSFSEYRRLIGALLFVGSGTRMDVSFAINYLSRYQKCATETHFRYALRVLRYLQETSKLKLVFRRTDANVIEGWADADWAADTVDRKSTGGILIRAFGNPVTWSCRKQNTVARASTYAEYIALADTVSELLPIAGVIKNLGVSMLGPIPVFEDNSGAVVLAAKGKFTKRAKHIEVAYNFVADYVQKGIIIVKKVDSCDQLADLLTKALGCERFCALRDAVSIT